VINTNICFCDFGNSLNNHSPNICEKCKLIFTLIDSLEAMSSVTCFRALSHIEKETLAEVGRFNVGRREIKPIELYDKSFTTTISQLLKTVRETLNNKTSGDANKQFSYSKSLVIALIKYTHIKDSNPIIAIANLDLNSIVIDYTLTYIPWIKDKYNDSIYQTISETSIDLKELININSLILDEKDSSYLLNKYEKKVGLPLENYLNPLINKLKEREENQKEFMDLHRVDFLRVVSVNLDLTPLNRSSLNLYYRKHDGGPGLKNMAGYEKDQEVYSTESPFFISRFLIGKDLIDNIKIITVCTLLLAENKIDFRYESVISKFIKCMKDDLIESEKETVDIIIEHLRNNSKIEFNTMLGYLNLHRIIIPMESDIEWMSRIFDRIIERSIVTETLLHEFMVADVYR